MRRRLFSGRTHRLFQSRRSTSGGAYSCAPPPCFRWDFCVHDASRVRPPSVPPPNGPTRLSCARLFSRPVIGSTPLRFDAARALVATARFSTLHGAVRVSAHFRSRANASRRLVRMCPGRGRVLRGFAPRRFRRRPLRAGTLTPARRASDSPIAIACLAFARRVCPPDVIHLLLDELTGLRARRFSLRGGRVDALRVALSGMASVLDVLAPSTDGARRRARSS